MTDDRKKFDIMKWMMAELFVSKPNDMDKILNLPPETLIYWHSWRASSVDWRVVTREEILAEFLPMFREMNEDSPAEGTVILDCMGGDEIDIAADSWVVPGDEDYWAMTSVKKLVEFIC